MSKYRAPTAWDTATIIEVIPYAYVSGQRKPYMVTRTKAEIMVARGAARWSAGSTRRIVEVKVAARGTLRVWRKTRGQGIDGEPKSPCCVMQLVLGESQGRNTGSRRGHSTSTLKGDTSEDEY